MNLKKKIDQVVFVKNIFYIFKDNNDNKILNFVIFKIRVIDQNNNIFRFSPKKCGMICQLYKI